MTPERELLELASKMVLDELGCTCAPAMETTLHGNISKNVCLGHRIAALDAPAPTPAPSNEIEKLAAMPDSAIDTSDIPEVTNWSKAERGKFYRKPAVPPRDIGSWAKQGLPKGHPEK